MDDSFSEFCKYLCCLIFVATNSCTCQLVSIGARCFFPFAPYQMQDLVLKLSGESESGPIQADCSIV